MRTFWTAFWWVWLAMLVIGDPIASWLGEHRYHEGDDLTDTHLLVTHINYGLRVAILAWLVYHFLFQHVRS